MVASSIPTALRERASVHPNGAAITYIDYEQDWAGVAETPDLVSVVSANAQCRRAAPACGGDR